MRKLLAALLVVIGSGLSVSAQTKNSDPATAAQINQISQLFQGNQPASELTQSVAKQLTEFLWTKDPQDAHRFIFMHFFMDTAYPEKYPQAEITSWGVNPELFEDLKKSDQEAITQWTSNHDNARKVAALYFALGSGNTNENQVLQARYRDSLRSAQSPWTVVFAPGAATPPSGAAARHVDLVDLPGWHLFGRRTEFKDRDPQWLNNFLDATAAQATGVIGGLPAGYPNNAIATPTSPINMNGGAALAQASAQTGGAAQAGVPEVGGSAPAAVVGATAPGSAAGSGQQTPGVAGGTSAPAAAAASSPKTYGLAEMFGALPQLDKSLNVIKPGSSRMVFRYSDALGNPVYLSVQMINVRGSLSAGSSLREVIAIVDMNNGHCYEFSPNDYSRQKFKFAANGKEQNYTFQIDPKTGKITIADINGKSVWGIKSDKRTTSGYSVQPADLTVSSLEQGQRNLAQYLNHIPPITGKGAVLEDLFQGKDFYEVPQAGITQVGDKGTSHSGFAYLVKNLDGTAGEVMLQYDITRGGVSLDKATAADKVNGIKRFYAGWINGNHCDVVIDKDGNMVVEPYQAPPPVDASAKPAADVAAGSASTSGGTGTTGGDSNSSAAPIAASGVPADTSFDFIKKNYFDSRFSIKPQYGSDPAKIVDLNIAYFNDDSQKLNMFYVVLPGNKVIVFPGVLVCESSSQCFPQNNTEFVVRAATLQDDAPTHKGNDKGAPVQWLDDNTRDLNNGLQAHYFTDAAAKEKPYLAPGEVLEYHIPKSDINKKIASYTIEDGWNATDASKVASEVVHKDINLSDKGIHDIYLRATGSDKLLDSFFNLHGRDEKNVAFGIDLNSSQTNWELVKTYAVNQVAKDSGKEDSEKWSAYIEVNLSEAENGLSAAQYHTSTGPVDCKLIWKEQKDTTFILTDSPAGCAGLDQSPVAAK